MNNDLDLGWKKIREKQYFYQVKTNAFIYSTIYLNIRTEISQIIKETYS